MPKTEKYMVVIRQWHEERREWYDAARTGEDELVGPEGLADDMYAAVQEVIRKAKARQNN